MQITLQTGSVTLTEDDGASATYPRPGWEKINDLDVLEGMLKRPEGCSVETACEELKVSPRYLDELINKLRRQNFDVRSHTGRFGYTVYELPRSTQERGQTGRVDGARLYTWRNPYPKSKVSVLLEHVRCHPGISLAELIMEGWRPQIVYQELRRGNLTAEPDELSDLVLSMLEKGPVREADIIDAACKARPDITDVRSMVMGRLRRFSTSTKDGWFSREVFADA